MRTTPHRFGFSIIASGLLFSTFIPQLSTVLAQGPLAPSGAPAPTMKTLDQLEPRKEINATNTPGGAGDLFIISTPGSYYLGANVTGVSGKNGIRIASPDVSLDLNGFALTGVPGSTAGIIALPGRNVTIRNGTICEWGTEGIRSLFIVYSLLEDLRLYKNGSAGLAAHGGCLIRGCVASYNLGPGFTFGATTSSTGESTDEELVQNCFATGNGGDGFQLRGGAITKCEARLNSGHGFSTVLGSTLTDCVASKNLSNGIHAGTGSTLTNCTASINDGDGIHADAGSTLTNCTARGNLGANGIFAGEGSTLLNCTARENQVEFGIQAELRSSVTNCNASANDSSAAESAGIMVGAQSKVDACTVTANTNSNGTATGQTGAGIIAGNSSTVRECTVVGNRGDGIRISNDSRVVGNNCDSNGFSAAGTADGAGIHCTGSDNRIESNNVTDNDRGFQVDSSGSLIIKNSASGSTGGSVNNYVIAASNADAAIETPGPGFTSTNPWANFSY